MKWYPLLYVGQKAEKKRDRIIWKIKCGAGLVDVYLITLASNGEDLFDIISTAFLKQRAVRRNLPMIIGIASGQKEAVELVQGIVEETIRETGTADVKQYLKDRIRKEGL